MMNPPAFPVTPHPQMQHDPSNSGMTLRDWFAGQVLAQLAPQIVFPQAVEDQLHRAGIKTDDFEAYTAYLAYGFADAMMAARGGK